MYALAIAVLVACFAVAKADGHLATWPGLPPISALGDAYPEHIIFACGFALISMGLALVAFVRHAQIESKLRFDVCNNIFFVAILLFFVPLVVAGAIPTRAWGAEYGWVHGASAGCGLIGLSSCALWIHVYLLIRRCRGVVVDQMRAAWLCYGFAICCNVGALPLLALFFLEPANTTYEWAGFTLIFAGQLPYFLFLWWPDTDYARLDGINGS